MPGLVTFGTMPCWQASQPHVLCCQYLPKHSMPSCAILAACSHVLCAVQDWLQHSQLGKSGFTAAFALIFLSELGDKTFFIAGLLAMKVTASAPPAADLTSVPCLQRQGRVPDLTCASCPSRMPVCSHDPSCSILYPCKPGWVSSACPRDNTGRQKRSSWMKSLSTVCTLPA